MQKQTGNVRNRLRWQGKCDTGLGYAGGLDPGCRSRLSVRRMMRSLLGGHGYTVLEARDACSAAWRHSRPRSNPITVLIAPVFLAEMTGAELARYAQTCYPRISVILTSGSQCCPFQVQGGWQVIQKPFTARIMLDLVRLAAAAGHQ